MSEKKNSQNIFKRLHIVPKLICLFIAFVLWIYVMEIDSPDYEHVFEDVPVTVVGTTQLENDKNLSVFSGYDALVDVTVKGQKTVISKYSEKDIIATVDVSEIEKSGMYTLQLFFDTPSGITLIDTSANELNMFIDKRTTANITLEAELKGYTLSTSEYALGDVTCEVDTITVTGPESVLNEIDHGLVEVNMGDEQLVQSLTTNGTVVLKNQNGENIESRYVKLSKPTVQVNVPVYGFKDVLLKTVTKHGFYTKDNSTVTVTPETVRVKGEPAVLQNLNHIELATIDEKLVNDNTDLIVDIPLPENVYAVEGQPTEANISVELNGFTKKTFIVDNIKIRNSEGKKVKALDESVAVTVMGESELMKDLTAEDITVSVDFTSFKENIGIVYAAADIEFDVKSDGIIYEIGVYSVQIQAK